MTLSDFIIDNMEALLQEWEQFAETLPPGRHMDRTALRDDAKQMLQQVAADMREPETRRQQESKSKAPVPEDKSNTADIAATHAHIRRREGFDLTEMVAEYRALRANVIRLWTQNEPSPGRQHLDQLTRFNEAIDRILVEAIDHYSDELNRSRELFLGILSHDLRSPLNVAGLSAQFLAKYGDLSGDGQEAVGRIINSVAHIEEMLSALLDVTRARLSGSLPIQPEDADLADLCRRVVEELRAAYPHRQIRLELEGDLRGCWDLNRLAQVLSNIAGNAIHHGACDELVTLTVKRVGEDIILQVHNYGDPIAEADWDRIFDPLTQTQRRRKGHKGLGLGLYIARALVHAHGGTIEVDSKAEKGTTFTVRLPREAAQHNGESKKAPGD